MKLGEGVTTSCKFRVLLSVALLLITARRLPAPIQEVVESPSPESEESAKPKPKQTAKPKPSERSESSTIQATPFAGTWSGTMNINFFGDIGYTFLIEPAQTTVKMWGTNKPSEILHTKADVCRASISADGISWTWSAWKWTLKPYPDGKTALVKVAGPFQNGSAVFGREK